MPAPGWFSINSPAPGPVGAARFGDLVCGQPAADGTGVNANSARDVADAGRRTDRVNVRHYRILPQDRGSPARGQRPAITDRARVPHIRSGCRYAGQIPPPIDLGPPAIGEEVRRVSYWYVRSFRAYGPARSVHLYELDPKDEGMTWAAQNPAPPWELPDDYRSQGRAPTFGSPRSARSRGWLLMRSYRT